MDCEYMFREIEAYMHHINFAYNCLVSYMSLYNSLEKYSNVLNKAPGFFTITQYALCKCMIIEFAKLYCGSGKEKTITKLINQVKANSNVFSEGNAKSICAEAEKKLLSQINPIVQKLRHRRDQDLVHNDPLFFYGLENPAVSNYISPAEFQSLHSFAFDLCSALLCALPTTKIITLGSATDDIKMFLKEYDTLLNLQCE